MSECALLLNLGQNLKMGHVGSKNRPLGQFLEKPWVLSRRHSFDPVFMKLCQNDFLTLNKRLSRQAMLSDYSSCSEWDSYFSDGTPIFGKGGVLDSYY